MQVARLECAVYRIPTDRPEADGTFSWEATTVLVVEASADAGLRGLGFSYGAAAAAAVVRDELAPVVEGCAIEAVATAWGAMLRAVRNIGRPGVAATAISAVDLALWDLRARAAGQPLFQFLGARRSAVPSYGSGGFTSYSEAELAEQLGGWAAEGFTCSSASVPRWRSQPASMAMTPGISAACSGRGRWTSSKRMRPAALD